MHPSLVAGSLKRPHSSQAEAALSLSDNVDAPLTQGTLCCIFMKDVTLLTFSVCQVPVLVSTKAGMVLVTPECC